MNKSFKFNLGFGWQRGIHGERWISFVNYIPTIGGGTHVEVARNAISKAVQFLNKSRSVLNVDIIRDGLCGIIHLSIDEPNFTSQAKHKLSIPRYKYQMESVT